MKRRSVFWIGLFLALAVAAPIALGTALALSRGWAESWRTADWSSSGLLPDASSVAEAKVIILSARTGGWKSIFAEHMSLVLKREGERQWTRYEVVGWGRPVRRNAYAPDARWYGNEPYIVAEVTGAEAERLIPGIEQSIGRYPYSARGSYVVWPGPNSNSFVSWVVRNTPGLHAELPPVAVGKDYLDSGVAAGYAPSGTGIMLSAWGALGLTVAMEEGLELNLLGMIIGIDPNDLAVKLPSLGKIGARNLF